MCAGGLGDRLGPLPPDRVRPILVEVLGTLTFLHDKGLIHGAVKPNNLFITDLDNRRIRKVDMKTNVVTTVAGNGEKGVPKDGEDATKHFTNNADQTGAQVGSTFKPFVLAAAMKWGVRDKSLGPDLTSGHEEGLVACHHGVGVDDAEVDPGDDAAVKPSALDRNRNLGRHVEVEPSRLEPVERMVA